MVCTSIAFEEASTEGRGATVSWTGQNDRQRGKHENGEAYCPNLPSSIPCDFVIKHWYRLVVGGLVFVPLENAHRRRCLYQASGPLYNPKPNEPTNPNDDMQFTTYSRCLIHIPRIMSTGPFVATGERTTVYMADPRAGLLLSKSLCFRIRSHFSVVVVFSLGLVSDANTNARAGMSTAMRLMPFDACGKGDAGG